MQYWYMAKASFRRYLTYRAATWAGLITNLFWGVMRSYFYIAIMATGTDFGGYNLQQLFGLTAWGQSLLVLLSIFGWWDLMRVIKSGEVIGDLWRPADFYWLWMSKDLGRALHAFLFRGLPLLISYSLIFRLPLPTSPLVWLGFLVSLTLAAMVSFAWRFMVNCVAFWTLEGRGMMTIAWSISGFLCGFVIPVDVFPPWLHQVALWTPFPSMFNTPLQIILERSPMSQWPALWAGQLLWLAVTMAVARMVLDRGTQRLVVQGG